MSLKITHLSVTLTIGGNSISLITEGLPDLAEDASKADPTIAEAAIKKRIKDGLVFRMEPGVVISTTVGDILSWMTVNLGAGDVEMPALLTAMTGEKEDALKGIIINLWGLSLSTTRNFTFNMNVHLTDTFYTSLGVPSQLTDIFTVDSLGIGMAYNPDP